LLFTLYNALRVVESRTGCHDYHRASLVSEAITWGFRSCQVASLRKSLVCERRHNMRFIGYVKSYLGQHQVAAVR